MKTLPEIRIFRRYRLLGSKYYRSIFRIQATILKAVRDFLYSRGFIELLAPVIAPVTDPGVRLAQEFAFDFYGERAVLVTSVILYKFAGLKIHDKVFFVAPNIRKEPERLFDFSRSLAEFRQIDIEVAYASLDEIISLSEDLIIYVLEEVKRRRKEELEYLGRELRIPTKPFKRLSYREAVEIIRAEGYELEETGELSAQAEEYLSRMHREPFWIIGYPPQSRGFYYKKKSDDELLDFDLIYPEGFGEGASGGERETDPWRARSRMLETGVDPRKYTWFLEMLTDGIPPCSGIGLGVERLTRYVTGVREIIDVIPFPKAPGYLGI